MTDYKLSPEARHRLWQCYALLLRLAGEQSTNTESVEDADNPEQEQISSAPDDSYKPENTLANNETTRKNLHSVQQ